MEQSAAVAAVADQCMKEILMAIRAADSEENFASTVSKHSEEIA